MRRTGKSKTCVWRWQQRFTGEGFDGLLRDKTRRSRIAEVAEGVVDLTPGEQPGEATHWTAAMMAKKGRDQRQLGATHLASAWVAAAPGAAVQALDRSQVRPQIARCGRAHAGPPPESEVTRDIGGHFLVS